MTDCSGRPAHFGLLTVIWNLLPVIRGKIMKRTLISVALAAFGMLCLCASLAAQTVTVTATHLLDGNALACPTGSSGVCTINWAPMLSSGAPTVYRRQGGGMATVRPMSAAVVNGAFSLSAVPDTALTTPTNLCFRVTFNTPTGSSLFGSCVQPSASNYWFSGGVANFDDWIPGITPQAQVVAGPTGPTGSTGPTGPTGGTGPTGPAGPGTINGLPSNGSNGINVAGTVAANGACPAGAPAGSVCSNGVVVNGVGPKQVSGLLSDSSTPNATTLNAALNLGGTWQLPTTCQGDRKSVV